MQSDKNSDQGPSDLEEELRRKEQEAEELKRKLKEREQKGDEGGEQDVSKPRSGDPYGREFSGRTTRELMTPTRESPGMDWLYEGGAFQAQPEDKEKVDRIVRRRLIAGGALAVTTIALAQVPDVSLFGPPRPQAFYVARMLRAQEALESASERLQQGDFDGARGYLAYAKKESTSDILEGASASLIGVKTQRRARELAQAVREDLEAADLEQYFRLPNVATQSLDYYANFTSRCASDGAQKLREMISFFPQEALDTARMQPSL